MMWTRCPFCHERVLTSAYPEHERAHTRRRADGQMDEHITLAPEQRFLGDLAGVPRIYYHARCGAQTGMPEEIIRSYLKNPFLYNGRTFCTGCHDYVLEGELVWVETGERLSDYSQRLKNDYVARHGGDWNAVLNSSPSEPTPRREVSVWRILILLLILVVVVPALVIDTGIALHFLAPSSSPSPHSPAPIVSASRPPASPGLPPPVILAPPTETLPPSGGPGGLRPGPGLREPMAPGDSTAAIREAAQAAIPMYIRQYHPVSSPTGRLTVTTTDVLQTAPTEALATVHYELSDTSGVGGTQSGAARVILQRVGPQWTAVNAVPLTGG